MTSISRRSLFAFVLALCLPLVAAAQYPQLGRVSTTIANGQSLSPSIYLNDDAVVAILMPSSWTSASITIQVSQDGTTWQDAYDSYGNEITITAAANRAIVFVPLELSFSRFIKLRSGTSSLPVNQGGARSITLITRRVQ